MLPWLYIHFPCLQLDGLLSQQSESTPVCIIDVKQNKVLQLNLAAKQQGITQGMGLASAVALSAELTIVEYQAEQEAKRLNELAQWLYQVVADIALFVPNGLAFNVKGMLALYRNLDNYWRAIAKVLKQQKVHYTMALAHSPTAARLLAKSAQWTPEQMISLATNQTSEIAIKPHLAQLPVERLEIHPQQIEQLHRLGVHQLAQLWQLPNKELGRRFGIELLNYLAKIDAKVDVGLTYYQPPKFFHKYLELFHEINQAQVLLFPLKRMVQEMSDFLLKHEWVITELMIQLEYREHVSSEIVIGSAQGEYQTERWLNLISLKIESFQLTAPVVGISLKTAQMIAKHQVTADLLAEQHGSNKSMSNNQLVSILQAKVGKAHIQRLTLKADHRPEYAFNAKAIAPDQSLQQEQQEQQSDIPKNRPLILLPKPQPLTQGYTLINGPERIRSAWWGKHSIYRDYFIANDNNGSLCWLFNDPENGWFLHGYFS